MDNLRQNGQLPAPSVIKFQQLQKKTQEDKQKSIKKQLGHKLASRVRKLPLKNRILRRTEPEFEAAEALMRMRKCSFCFIIKPNDLYIVAE